MSLETLDHLINAWVWIDEQIRIYGPGLALTAACIAISWTCAKVRDWRERRRNLHARRAELRAEREQMTRLRDAINTAPLIPTQPGHDDQLLADCWTAWKADEPRKEKP